MNKGNKGIMQNKPMTRITFVAFLTIASLAGCKKAAQNELFLLDDYRTRHLIKVGLKKDILDFPVGKDEQAMTRAQGEFLSGFLEKYDKLESPILTIFIPVGGENQSAVKNIMPGLIGVAHTNGVPLRRIFVKKYQVPKNVSGAIRFSFERMQAYTEPCNRWGMDLSENGSNKNYPSFGCSYQNNLAVQIADPYDLLGPRKRIPVDAGNRDAVIEEYRSPPEPWRPETAYEGG